MDQPNLQDKITGTVRTIQRGASDLVALGCEVAAKAGVPENEVHRTVEQIFRENPSNWSRQSTSEQPYQSSFGSGRS